MVCVIIIFSGYAIAAPSLIVTPWPSDEVIEYVVGGGNEEGVTEPLPDYLGYFADVVRIGSDAQEGYYLGNHDQLTVATNYGTEIDIYLIVEGATPSTSGSYGGESLIFDDTGFIEGECKGGYKPDYLYIALNAIIDNAIIDYDWDDAPDDFPAKGYSFFTAPFTISGWGPDLDGTPNYIFAAADINGEAGLQFHKGGKKDDFSPKTSSTHSPEPATFLILGIGLIGGLCVKKYIL